MAAPGDDARGHVEKALAAQMSRQGFAAVDSAAMEIAAALCEQAQPLDPGGGLEVELDGGEPLVEPGDGVRKDCLPGRVGGHAEAPGAPGAGGVDPALGGLDLAQDALRGLDEGGAERGEAHPLGRALEEPGAELALEPCDDAGQGGLGHRDRARPGHDRRTAHLQGLHQCREGAQRQLRARRCRCLPPPLQASRGREGRRASASRVWIARLTG